MKLLQCITLLLLLLSACTTRPTVARNLLPGITYYEGSEKLTGKMVFLLTRNIEEENNDEKSAAIYEFDLARNTLRKVTDAPHGFLFVSRDGDLSCVTFWYGYWRQENDTNLFIHSGSMGQNRILKLDTINYALPVGGHVFIVSDMVGYRKLLDFDMTRNETRWFEMPGASKWEKEDYQFPCVARGKTNTLQFCYNYYGKPLSDGKDYTIGYYHLNVQSGKVQSIPDSEEQMYSNDVAFDGRFVFFTGSMGPSEGFELVTSPWSKYYTERNDPQGKNVKVLHKFSRLQAILAGENYYLWGISPCGRYALVRYDESVMRKNSIFPGQIRIYYLVDVTSGDTRVLFRDHVERDTIRAMSPFNWVQAR